MDRKQAQQFIGKQVAVSKGKDGVYGGELLKIIAEPKKPWRGIVRITSVVTLPEPLYKNNHVELTEPIYEDGDMIECAGSQLKILPDDENDGYVHSILNAIRNRSSYLFEQVNLEQAELTLLKRYTAELNHLKHHQGSEDLLHNPDYVSYHYQHSSAGSILVDTNGHSLYLDDCPFELEWYSQGQIVQGHYEGNGIFRSQGGQAHSPEEGDSFYINKNQFDPYFILRNELEPAALYSFEKALELYNLAHHDLSTCHNSLLLQLLNSQGKTEFKGVNLLTYKSEHGLIIVQHHYQRKLIKRGTDEIFDRFEFTTDQGKRSVFTYRNEMSK